MVTQLHTSFQRKHEKHYKRWLSGFLISMVSITAYLILFSQAEIITLCNREPLPLGASPVLPPTGTNLVAILDTDDTACVIKCEDIKTDLVILIRTESGKVGYISEGDYVLVRKNITPYTLVFEFDDITFSCRGMFEHRSRSSCK